MVITLASKEEGGKSAVYTFHVTRPRDTTKTIKNTTGAVLVPEGRNLLATKYKNQPEGAIFRAGNNGEPTATTGTTGTVYFYRTYAQNGLEQFRMTFTGNTVYEHLRYSVDDGETWTELGQNFGTTDAVSFPDSGVVKVTLQILDDATYAANDGFDGGEPNVYTFWVERLPAVEEGALPYILTAETGFGDWYPAFNKEWIGNYNVVVPNGTAAADAPVLTYTVAEGAVVKLGTKDQTPDEHGVYTLKLTASNQTLNITSADGSYTNSYGFKYQSKSKYDVPDKVVDFLCVNSQYTNVSFGIMPETTLSGSLKSTGNWGGYITYYYENGLKDDPNNRYGVDFYIYGNSNINNADGTKKSFAEPGQVWVSEDGESWYALAGSEHYNEDTIWDYAVTYRKSASGRTAWVDNQGNSNDGVSQCGLWVDPKIYYMNDLAKSDSFTLTGIVLPGESGKITGSADNMYAKDIQFGYVDAFPNGTIGAEVNPYMENPANSNGFDLAWAVDDAGLPIDVSGKEFHYVKIVTASNIWASGINEKSTEVTQMIRTAPAESAVGKTALPKAVVVSDGVSNRSFSLEEGKQVYDLDVGDMKYVALSLDGAAADDNIYFNNLRSDKLEGVKVTKEGGGKLVRLIVQNGEKEPAVLLLRLTGSAEESDGLIEGIKVAVGGSVRQAKTKDGQTYSLTVGSRIETVSVSVVTAGSVRIDGEEPAEEYPLQEGANTFSIEVEDGEKTQTVSLVVTREAAPEASGREITVTFSLYGDEMHDEETVHTYQKTSGQLQRWIAPTRYTTAAESTVLDVFETALRAAGYAWTNDGGNYISEINGLAEFTNGSRSGWMYLLNGNHPDFGVAEQKLKNGDVIVFHYTDDYTQEEGSQRFRSGSAASVGEEKNDAAASGGTSARFTDVPDGAWYEDAVNFAADHELMNGTGETTFSPDATMSRSMLMMVLARMAGEDTAKGENWYDVGMAWAKENGISDGTDPEADITREQMMTMLYRYVQKQGGGFTGTWMFRLEYNDRDNVSQWAYEAVCWCTSNGIVNGMSGGMLNPQGTATRAQVAAILARFAQLDNA